MQSKLEKLRKLRKKKLPRSYKKHLRKNKTKLKLLPNKKPKTWMILLRLVKQLTKTQPFQTSLPTPSLWWKNKKHHWIQANSHICSALFTVTLSCNNLNQQKLPFQVTKKQLLNRRTNWATSKMLLKLPSSQVRKLLFNWMKTQLTSRLKSILRMTKTRELKSKRRFKEEKEKELKLRKLLYQKRRNVPRREDWKKLKKKLRLLRKLQIVPIKSVIKK